jgi:hypothetical protein
VGKLEKEKGHYICNLPNIFVIILALHHLQSLRIRHSTLLHFSTNFSNRRLLFPCSGRPWTEYGLTARSLTAQDNIYNIYKEKHGRKPISLIRFELEPTLPQC